jgi:hypothetical protein
LYRDQQIIAHFLKALHRERASFADRMSAAQEYSGEEFQMPPSPASQNRLNGAKNLFIRTSSL